MTIFERFSEVSQRWPNLWKKMYLSPERREVFSSLRSLGLSKDPKDAQRQPYCFPDVEAPDQHDCNPRIVMPCVNRRYLDANGWTSGEFNFLLILANDDLLGTAGFSDVPACAWGPAAAAVNFCWIFEFNLIFYLYYLSTHYIITFWNLSLSKVLQVLWGSSLFCMELTAATFHQRLQDLVDCLRFLLEASEASELEPLSKQNCDMVRDRECQSLLWHVKCSKKLSNWMIWLERLMLRERMQAATL